MSGRQSYAERCTRIYALRGTVAHLSPPHFGELGPLCPARSGAWLGTGSQDEYDQAASLPACPACGEVASRQPLAARIPPDPAAERAPVARREDAPASPPAGAGPRRPIPPAGVAVPRSSPLLSERQAAEMSPGPETRRPGPAAVRAGAPAPVAAVPDGSRLSGPAAVTGPAPGILQFPPLREVTQTILYDPELNAREVYGNCMQAAMASALGLELDAVPHFGTFAWWDAAARLWLRGRQLDWRWVPVSRGLPPGRCVVIGASPRSTGRHAMAGDGGLAVWDPHPSRAGLTEIQGAYEFRRWPGGAPEDEACVTCSAQIAPLVRPPLDSSSAGQHEAFGGNG